MEFDALDLQNQLAGSPDSKQRAIVRVLLVVVRPFGHLDRVVIEPSEFDRIADAIDAELDSGDGSCAGIVAGIEAMPAIRASEEPGGVGFFALGAIVEVLYAARVAAGVRAAAGWALARADDLLDFADDELGTSGRDLLLRWVGAALDTSMLPDHSALLAETTAMAIRLDTGNQ